MTKYQARRKLRNYLINPQHQLRYILWTTMTSLLLIGVYSSVFYHFVRENYRILVDMSPMEDNAKSQLYQELYQMMMILGGASVVFLVVVALIGLVISHRSAGPMYRFKDVFMKVQNGDRAARVRLRPKDDFKDVAEECNKMIDKLSGG